MLNTYKVFSTLFEVPSGRNGHFLAKKGQDAFCFTNKLSGVSNQMNRHSEYKQAILKLIWPKYDPNKPRVQFSDAPYYIWAVYMSRCVSTHVTFGPMNFCQKPLIFSISKPLSSTCQQQAYLMSRFHHSLYSQYSSRKSYLYKTHLQLKLAF